MIHNFRHRLVQGDLLLGTLVSLNSPEVVELLAAAGFFLALPRCRARPPGVERVAGHAAGGWPRCGMHHPRTRSR